MESGRGRNDDGVNCEELTAVIVRWVTFVTNSAVGRKEREAGRREGGKEHIVVDTAQHTQKKSWLDRERHDMEDGNRPDIDGASGDPLSGGFLTSGLASTFP